MTALEEIKAERIRKRDLLLKEGMDPYATKGDLTHYINSFLKDIQSLIDSDTVVTLVGRVMSIRSHGQLVFVDIYDGTDKVQVLVSKKSLSDKLFNLFIEAVDTGDFVEFTGVAGHTKRGLPALMAKEWRMLTKSINAIPNEHFGIKNEDERYRKRYLDILLDQDLRDMFARKEKFWRVTRQFMRDSGFMEIDTPTLEITTGGAEARPFQTHHNDFGIDVYLRISVGELWQKRLMASGYPKTFEIGRAYRNEGTSPEHLQEFINLEFYWAYADYNEGMSLVKELYRHLAKEVYGTTKFSVHGHDFDLADDWEILDYVEEIKKRTDIDLNIADKEALIRRLNELSVKYEGDSLERLTDSLWKYCRKQITGPAFVVHHPISIAPLAKQRKDKKTVEMFHPLIAGSEVGRGYSELNDPEDQATRFREQQQLLEAGDEEAMMPDWEFVEMLEYGMPPTCGFGFGERLFAFFEGKPLRETQLFPLLKPRTHSEPKSNADQ